jgi:hypothetical protein
MQHKQNEINPLQMQSRKKVTTRIFPPAQRSRRWPMGASGLLPDSQLILALQNLFKRISRPKTYNALEQSEQCRVANRLTNVHSARIIEMQSNIRITR